MDLGRICALLQPFLTGAAVSGEKVGCLPESQLQRFAKYLDLLLMWNEKVNLTAVRDPDEIVTRHFGESLFLGRQLFPSGYEKNDRLVDFGSGAGFPGVPIKLWAPSIRLNLVESNNKKAIFLREVIRALELKDAEVFSRRAESFSWQAEVVTMRAVERFDCALPIGIQLVAPGGRIALLIGEPQIRPTHELAREISWDSPIPVPQSESRVALIGRKPE